MSDEQRIAELESQILKSVRQIYRVPFDDNGENGETWQAYAADLDMLRMDAEHRLAVVTADNAALLKEINEHCWQPGDTSDYCVFCLTDYELASGFHGGECITEAEHPGSRFLERLKAAEKVITEARDATQMVGTGNLERALADYDKVEELNE